MRIFKYIYVFVCLGQCFLLSGQQIIETDISIPWKKNIKTDSIEYLYFTNAKYLNEDLANVSLYKTPYFEKTFELKRSSKIVFAITDANVISIPNDTLGDYPSFGNIVNKRNIGSKFQYQADGYHTGNITKLRLRIFPVRNLGNGTFEGLAFFRLKIMVTDNNYELSNINYKTQSVLNTGTWARVKINKDGVYKLTNSDLKSLGISNPASVRIYGCGGERLPIKTNAITTDDLIETAVYYGSDYVLFYGKNPDSWINYSGTNKFFKHSLNKYSEWSYYFITSDLGKGVGASNVNYSTLAGGITCTEFDDYQFHEEDRSSLGRSGLEWVGESFDTNSSYDIKFKFSGTNTNTKATLYCSFVGTPNSVFSIGMPDGSTSDLRVTTTSTGANYIKERETYDVFNFTPQSDESSIKVTFPSKGEIKGYINYLGLNVTRALKFEGNWMAFRKLDNLNSSLSFNISSVPENVVVWDITNIKAIANVPYSKSGNNLQFGSPSGVVRQFVVFNPSGTFDKPVIKAKDVGKIKSQNLHGISCANMVIVVPDNKEFIEQAQRLANKRQAERNWNVPVVTTTQIYNEFSSGSPDLSAIRNFSRMLWTRCKDFKYLLLFGDGSFDNKYFGNGNPNLIPVYESKESFDEERTFTSDDFYAWFDDKIEDGKEAVCNLDISVGRLPAKDSVEARQLVDKILTYENSKAMGDWRNTICMAADDDDDDQPYHMAQANTMCNFLNMNFPQFFISKIYIGAYNQITTSTGQSCPEAKEKVDLNMNKGMLIFNYVGHGSENQLAHEDIVDKYNLQNWRNGKYFPLVFTASCEVSRFDDVDVQNRGKSYGDRTSLGEAMLLKPDGGAISLFSTTRVVFSGGNRDLNNEFYYSVFNKDKDNKYYCLGDIFRDSKNYNASVLSSGQFLVGDYDTISTVGYSDNNNSGSRGNALNFTLLGDPSMRLSAPGWNGVRTDYVNDSSVYLKTDTLKALKLVTIKGHIEDEQGDTMKSFNGTVVPAVYDKALNRKIFSDYEENRTTFKVFENMIFRGKAKVENGKFNYSFIVPKDINYNIGLGSAYYYAYNNDVDLNGQSNRFYVGGLNDNIIDDNDLPELTLYMNDTTFVDGGITNTNPWLLVKTNDFSGISTSGWGIGHDIIAVLDDDNNKTYTLNDFYMANENTYRTGFVKYPLSDLSEGLHTINVRIWDTYNNSNEADLRFKVVGDTKLKLMNVRNYPNPAKDYTNFIFEHNFPEQNLVVTIRIFSSMGSLEAVLKSNLNTVGFTSEPLYWNLRNLYGQKLGQGLYFYQIEVKTVKNGTCTGTGKLLVQ